MKALVLAGGSIKGAFQAGAVAELLRRGWVPDSIYGVSVGALNGAFVASRAGGSASAIGLGSDPNDTAATWTSIADDLESFWREKITSFRVLGKKRSLPCLIWDIARCRFKGLLKMDGLDRLITREISPENLRRSPVRFYAVSVNIADGRLVMVGSGGSSASGDPGPVGRSDRTSASDVPDTADPPDIRPFILASTRIPILMPIEWIDSQPLLDGGIRDVAPLKHAVDAGADEIIAVLCHPRSVSRTPFDPGNLMQLAGRVMELVIHEILSNDLDLAHRINDAVQAGTDTKHRILRLTEIRPAAPLEIEIERFSKGQIRDVVDLGKSTVREALA
ncbi:MAG: patatin-like phospholipase family protein [Candidatus Eisenbacteria sp.]|nr:patatin-like phospholipase family protein [Candidatus Eisenbacteria bacterium]